MHLNSLRARWVPLYGAGMSGGKYGKNRARQARRHTVSDAAEDAPWEPTLLHGAIEQLLAYDVGSGLRVTQRTVRCARTGMLVEFAIVVSRLVGDRWSEALCIDTCHHGSVHRHRNGDHTTTPDRLFAIESASDVQRGLSIAIDEAYDLVQELEE
jgi:hypothetical protein